MKNILNYLNEVITWHPMFAILEVALWIAGIGTIILYRRVWPIQAVILFGLLGDVIFTYSDYQRYKKHK